MLEVLSESDIEEIKRLCRELNERGVSCNVSFDEFVTYLTAESYKVDSFTIRDILDNRYLLIHELVEITVLKSKGYSIDEDVFRRAYSDSYEAHLEAIDVELYFASKMGILAGLGGELTI